MGDLIGEQCTDNISGTVEIIVCCVLFLTLILSQLVHNNNISHMLELMILFKQHPYNTLTTGCVPGLCTTLAVRIHRL